MNTGMAEEHGITPIDPKNDHSISLVVQPLTTNFHFNWFCNNSGELIFYNLIHALKTEQVNNNYSNY
jgi:hypothetical protein